MRCPARILRLRINLDPEGDSRAPWKTRAPVNGNKAPPSSRCSWWTRFPPPTDGSPPPHAADRPGARRWLIKGLFASAGISAFQIRLLISVNRGSASRRQLVFSSSQNIRALLNDPPVPPARRIAAYRTAEKPTPEDRNRSQREIRSRNLEKARAPSEAPSLSADQPLATRKLPGMAALRPGVLRVLPQALLGNKKGLAIPRKSFSLYW